MNTKDSTNPRDEKAPRQKSLQSAKSNALALVDETTRAKQEATMSLRRKLLAHMLDGDQLKHTSKEEFARVIRVLRQMLDLDRSL